MSQSCDRSPDKPASRLSTCVPHRREIHRLPTPMRRSLTMLLLSLTLLVTAAVVGSLAGCGDLATNTTLPVAETTATTIASTTTMTEVYTTTTEPTTTTTTEPPPLPLVLAGYEDAEVRTVSVVVDDKYPKIEGGANPFLAELVVDALEMMGVVGIDGGLDCDASLTFELEGRALSAQYSGDAGDFTAYSGAAYTGAAQFSVVGLESERWQVKGRLDPQFAIFGTDYLEPVDAPFESAFLEPMLTTFSRIWGPEATIETMGVWPAIDWEGGGSWVASVATEVMPRLMDMRLSDSSYTSSLAYDYLAQIVHRKAVPAKDRSTIVRTLIADMDSPDHYAGEALGILAQPEEAGFYMSEDEMTYLGPWEPEKWTEWADAHGY